MNKYKLYILLFTFFLVCIPNIVNASEDAIINGNDVRIREGAGTNYDIIATVNENTSISVVDKTLYTGTGCSAKWYKITYDDKTAYVCSSYVSFITSTYTGINVIDWTARVDANNVAVRKKADKTADLLDALTLGANVTVLKTVSGGSSGCTGGKWYQIKYYGDKTGYICKNYVTFKNDINAKDEEYEKELASLGFPESYFPYLTYLHNKYPNWIFKPGKTGLDFSSSVNSESGKCYMQTKNNNYRTSSTPAEGSSWFKVNKGVIAFYMDPRNWLTEERIFMFEKLDYSSELENEYPLLIKSVFGSGKLGDEKYTVPMFNAGKQNKISPVHIASRIKLEVSADGSSSTSGGEFTWKGKKYSGYYNFFNIGAYETTISGVKYSAVTRGLAYAAKLIKRDGEPWNNIQTAITEGSSFLANGYVTKGQGTIYYQKFNVGPNAYYSSYTHQYMTNIQAPATEGNASYNSYKKSSLLNQTFIFEIPVYKNIPLYTSLPNSGDTNNDLKSLSVEGYSITPAFDKDILYYESYVPSSVESINIKAETSSTKASISGTGEIKLTSNENSITVVVTSESGETNSYIVVIKKVENGVNVESTLNGLPTTIQNEYLTNIKNGTLLSDIESTIIKNGASSVKITNSKNEAVASSITSTGQIITITTLLETKSYTLVVKGDTSGDGQITILDLLQLRKHLKKSSLLTKERFYAADTSGDGNVTILDLLQMQKHLRKEKLL